MKLKSGVYSRIMLFFTVRKTKFDKEMDQKIVKVVDDFKVFVMGADTQIECISGLAANKSNLSPFFTGRFFYGFSCSVWFSC